MISLQICMHARYESRRHVADGIVADGTNSRGAVKQPIMKTEED